MNNEVPAAAVVMYSYSGKEATNGQEVEQEQEESQQRVKLIESHSGCGLWCTRTDSYLRI